jgi:diguanylate cyclase (GGDEF)-like protein
MPVQSAPSSGDPAADHLRSDASRASVDNTIPFRGPREVRDEDLEEVLSSALVATDKELGDVLREMDEISSNLKSEKVDKDLLRAMVHPAVWCAVKHMLMERELRHLALTDDLTCLYNRRGFFAAATQQLKVARRNEETVLLLYCDVDNLKTINDGFGHREGDLALVRTADALEEAFRDADVLARLGGDEFAVLASEASPQDQEMIVNRLKGSLKKASQGESRYRLSLSIGAAWFDPQRAVSLGQLMEAADRAMYREKRNRRRFRSRKPRSLPVPASGRQEEEPVSHGIAGGQE